MKKSSRLVSPKILALAMGILLLLGIGFATGGLRTGFKQAILTATFLRAQWNSYGFGVTPVKPLQARISEVDGMPQVYVPAGEFEMGIDDIGFPASQPLHTINLDAFWIDQYEVSNAQFALCVEAKKCRMPSKQVYIQYFDPAYADYPVVYVAWKDALTYCTWAGRTLPTEAQWEKAARGTDGRHYPWGNALPDSSRANFDSIFGKTVPVDRYPLGASPYGAFNMAGNVREWVADWYGENYYSQAPTENPTGPELGHYRSLRGGAYGDTLRQMQVYTRFKHQPTSPGINRGFRCAQPAP